MTTSTTRASAPAPAPRPDFAELLAAEETTRRHQRERLLRDEDVQVTVAQREVLDGSLAEIAAARARLADGSFGTCVRCGGSIPVERLEVRPWAATCTGCAGR